MTPDGLKYDIIITSHRGNGKPHNAYNGRGGKEPLTCQVPS